MPSRSLTLLVTPVLFLTALPLSADASEFLAAQSRGGAITSQLTLKVTGLTQGGQLRVGLYDSEAAYEAEQDREGRTVPVSAETTSVTFRNLPVGEYAVKVFHDQDNDGKLDTTLGIPSEPYGFSNNASDPFSAPEWHEAKFSVLRGTMVQTIDLD